MRPVLLVTLSLFAAALPAQKKFVLSIDSFTRGPALAGYPPSDVRWSGDSRRLYFQWKQPTDPVLKPADTYVVERDGSGLRKLSEEEARLAPPTLGDTSKDRKQTVFTRDGDIFLYDRPSGNTRRITRTGDAEASPRFTRDGRRVWFTRGGNLYTLSLDGGMLEQLTDIRSATTASSPAAPPAAGLGFGFGQGRGAQQQSQSSATGEPQRGTDSQEYIKKEERELLDIVRQKAAIREENEARRKREHPRKPYTLQARQTVGALSLSPDEKTVIASVLEPGERARNTIVPNYITESAYTEDISSRGKAGDTQGRSRLAIIDVETGDSRFVDISHISALPKSGTTPKPEVPKPSPDPSADSGQARRPAAPPTRDIQLAQPVWSDDGSKAVLMARAADNKDRWILALDPATGKTRTLVHDHDDAWIGGPGMFTLGWLANNQDVYFQSERTGYSHLYLVSHDGGEPRPLTSGNWEVHTVRLSEDKSTLYLTTNEGDPSQVHLYSLPAQGGPRVKITTRIGHHAITLSPDEKWIADIYSYTNRPPELYVMENRGGADQKKLTSSPTEEFWTYDWREPPIIKIRARDGVEVPARLYKPANFRKGGPAVIFVHGAGYLQNVHRWWQQYYREYMFHHLLMERGYIVIDADYRGSAGYGRDWRTAIYRHMGGRDLDDQVDAARWLVSQHGVDPKRIGLYGGSYGGFITLMAMFTQPDVFAAGAALRPVTDWAHYNNGYTGNILNVPQRDAEAYKRSSPIYFANGLKGALLICHGMVDTNVHFQDTVRLVQKLIELGKENWELAVFPVEDHAFAQPSSWADEYKRIFKLFEQNLRLKP